MDESGMMARRGAVRLEGGWYRCNNNVDVDIKVLESSLAQLRLASRVMISPSRTPYFYNLIVSSIYR